MSESGLADFAPQNILALCAEAHRAVAVLLEPIEGVYRLAGWQRVHLPAGTVPDDCPVALAQAITRLGNRLGIGLWDAQQQRPRQQSSDPALADGVGQVVAVADVLPPLRVWLAGLTSGESLAAGEAALAGALAELVAVCRPGPHAPVSGLAAELEALRPDVALVVGGYDRRESHSQARVLALSQRVTDAIAQLEPEERPLFCFAGNRWASNPAFAYWQAQVGRGAGEVVANVLPAPGRPSQTALHGSLGQYYWHRSLKEPAIRKVAGWVSQPGELRSTHWAFVQAVRLWQMREDLPELHGLYAGADRWLHVWAAEESNRVNGGVWVRFVRPGERPDFLGEWPPVRLVSGPWPDEWRRPTPHWWDPLGLVPVVANVGQVAPAAAVQVLAADILSGGGGQFSNF